MNDGTNTANEQSTIATVRIDINDVNEIPYFDAIEKYEDIPYYTFTGSEDKIPQLYLPEQSATSSRTGFLLGSCKRTGTSCQIAKELPGKLVAYDQDDSSKPSGTLTYSITNGAGNPTNDVWFEMMVV